MSGINWKSIRSIRWNEDDTINKVKKYKKTGELPTNWTYMKLYRFRKLFDIFTLKNNELYLIIDNIEDLPEYYKDTNGELLFQVNLPLKFKVLNNEKERNEVIDNYYKNIMSNGYRSSKSLYERLSKEFLNISRRHVENRVKEIEVEQMEIPLTETTVMKITCKKSERPLQEIELDLIDITRLIGDIGLEEDSSLSNITADLMDRSVDSRPGNGIKYLLICLDTFSKFVFVEQLENKDSKNIVYILENIICREGKFENIKVKNTDLITDDFIDTCKKFNIKYNINNSKGQIERFTLTLKKTILKSLNHYDNYTNNLHLLIYSYNTTRHNTTKKTPFEIHRRTSQLIQFS